MTPPDGLPGRDEIGALLRERYLTWRRIDHADMSQQLIDDMADALLARLRPAWEKLFPIQIELGYGKPHPLRIPWAVAEKAYSRYAAKYGTDQSLERLAERGGFCPGEMDAFHPGWIDESSEVVALRADLRAVVQMAEKHLDATAQDGPVQTETWIALQRALARPGVQQARKGEGE